MTCAGLKFESGSDKNILVSRPEIELREFLVENSYNDLKFNDRKLISPHEVDILDDARRISYEFCGKYWHSDIFKNKTYHVDKLNRVEKKGYKLFTIFENVYYDKHDILMNMFNKDNKKALQVKDCEIIQCEHKNISKFIDKHHIKGSRKATINYKVMNKKGIIVGAASFNKYKEGLQLVRFVTSRRITSILQEIISRLPLLDVYYFADRCYNYRYKNLYLMSGFKEVKITDPSYFYCKGKKTISKNSISRRKLSRILKVFDSEKSEYDNMEINGYYRVWNCGNIKYKLERNK